MNQRIDRHKWMIQLTRSSWCNSLVRIRIWRQLTQEWKTKTRASQKWDFQKVNLEVHMIKNKLLGSISLPITRMTILSWHEIKFKFKISKWLTHSQWASFIEVPAATRVLDLPSTSTCSTNLIQINYLIPLQKNGLVRKNTSLGLVCNQLEQIVAGGKRRQIRAWGKKRLYMISIMICIPSFISLCHLS